MQVFISNPNIPISHKVLHFFSHDTRIDWDAVFITKLLF